MATEAQVTANRLNAQKSTGPRTPEGKALVARNAVKHGLLGEQIVVEGEDRLKFAFHRDEMMRALTPVGEVEITLAERLVGLSWRLQRIERLQVQAFETLCAGALEGLADEMSDEKLALGRIVVQDFSGPRVLDKLLMYERRIEHSLCRILGELRRERLYQNLEARTQDDGNKQVLLERLMRKMGAPSPTAVLRMEPGCARWEEPEGVSSQVSRDGAEDPEALWEKVATGKCEIPVACIPRSASAGQEMVRDTHPTASNGSLGTAAGAPGSQALIPELLRQTNPISREANKGQVLDNTGVSSAWPPDRRGETKPIPAVHEASEAVTAVCGAAQGPAAVAAGR